MPLLCVFENGTLYEFESTFLIEHPWKLSEKDASLSAGLQPSHSSGPAMQACWMSA